MAEKFQQQRRVSVMQTENHTDTEKPPCHRWFACLFFKCTHACKRTAKAFRWNRVLLRTWVHLNPAPICPSKLPSLSTLQRQLVQFAPKCKETPLSREVSATSVIISSLT